MIQTYYLCNVKTKEIKYIGPLPEAWENIPGLSSYSYDTVKNLGWAGHPDLGFLDEYDALKIGVDKSIIGAQKLKSSDNKWDEVRRDRDSRIQQVSWRIERHNTEVALGRTPTENVMAVLKYMQDLRDITKQSDPFNISWPNYPG